MSDLEDLEEIKEGIDIRDFIFFMDFRDNCLRNFGEEVINDNPPFDCVSTTIISRPEEDYRIEGFGKIKVVLFNSSSFGENPFQNYVQPKIMERYFFSFSRN
jgi:hypothetical protein